jgi:G3E family GTPase
MIETTGLADPAPVLHTVMAHPYFMLRFRVDGVVTLVDTVNGNATLDAHEEAVKQAAMADRLVVSKTDLLTAGSGAVRDLRARLKKLNPSAVLLDAANGEATAGALLDAGIYDPDRKIPDVRRWLNAEAFAARGADDHSAHIHSPSHGDGSQGEGEKPDVNRHDARIRAFCMRHDAPLAPATLDLFLELLRKAHGPRLLRVKGIVALGDDPSRPLVIHGVQHVFHPPVRLAAWPDADHSTRMVLILCDVEPSFVETLWQTLTRRVEPGAATPANPLAPTMGGLLA